MRHVSESMVPEGYAIMAHLEEGQAVLEGLDSKLGQQSGLGRTNLVTGLDQVHIADNLNGTLVDLGGNTQGLIGKESKGRVKPVISPLLSYLPPCFSENNTVKPSQSRCHPYLEERGLGGIHAGGTRGDVDVVGGGETDTGGGSDLVLLYLGLDVIQVT